MSMAGAVMATTGMRESTVSRQVAGAVMRRVVVLASADVQLRSKLAETLKGLRWEVRQASGGAELFAMLEPRTGTIVLDSWLPDLDVAECVSELTLLYPEVDLLALDGSDFGAKPPQGPFRNEILHALRGLQQAEDAVRDAGVDATQDAIADGQSVKNGPQARGRDNSRLDVAAWVQAPPAARIMARQQAEASPIGALVARASIPLTRPAPVEAVPELLGTDPRMLEVSRRIRLVAPRSTAVLVQGPTGTGKELVARALHRLSPRAHKPFVALNCAAIPEALLEAELFGHTRGAFTGATQGRTGRLEAAHGGTLFLDEIGELPLALQAKLLRFVECGELQRVGENEPVRVDVRIIAATHRRLRKMVEAGLFRADLFFRLSVFLIETPSLAGRGEDIRLLARRALQRMAQSEPVKALTPDALNRLVAHSWPGNVRELEHTLERAWILSEGRSLIGLDEIDFGDDGEA